jgi:hypothetical protein
VDETKRDGYRPIIRRNGDTVKLFTRRGHDWTDRYPAAAELRASSFTLDGEAMACGADGIALFDASALTPLDFTRWVKAFGPRRKVSRQRSAIFNPSNFTWRSPELQGRGSRRRASFFRAAAIVLSCARSDPKRLQLFRIMWCGRIYSDDIAAVCGAKHITRERPRRPDEQ